jgi:hypothetical protein
MIMLEGLGTFLENNRHFLVFLTSSNLVEKMNLVLHMDVRFEIQLEFTYYATTFRQYRVVPRIKAQVHENLSKPASCFSHKAILHTYYLEVAADLLKHHTHLFR